MDLEVVGRHALFFDDDAMAAFVNSSDALVDWNSLQIDRYDVRHFLSAPLPPRRRLNAQSSIQLPDFVFESELDQERYLDLPPLSDEPGEEAAKPGDESGYHAVTFSYGNADHSAEQKNAEGELDSSEFRPPFAVPESLLQRLPSTEKVHQIIARTATFVSKHGGQSEIVLRVKQGDNPTFGFLMPDHPLYPYFRFLVDHQELLQPDTDEKAGAHDQTANTTPNLAVGGALSLLGSVYGSGEDEDSVIEVGHDVASVTTVNTSSKKDSHGLQNNTDFKLVEAEKDKGDIIAKHPPTSNKEKAPVLKRNPLIAAPKTGTTSNVKQKDDSSAFSHSLQKSKEPVILEPPSDLKRLIDKIVEFIVKNGKQFETTLREQDSKHGKFPFLLPSDQYHSYYLKVLQRAEESKVGAKNYHGRDDLAGWNVDKRALPSKSNDALGYDDSDLPFECDRKEKFKMVIGKAKKEMQEPPSKATQQEFGISVDATAAAAILQAATRGFRNSDLGIISSIGVNSHGREVGQSSNFRRQTSSELNGIIQMSDQDGRYNSFVPVTQTDKGVAENAFHADPSEAHLTREQKLKAERLKRAKMFVAKLKSGAGPSNTEPSRTLPAEPVESGAMRASNEVNLVNKAKDVSCDPVHNCNPDESESTGRKHFGDENSERRSRRKYRSRSERHDMDEENDDEEDSQENHSAKKHQSHGSSWEGNDGKEKDEDERAHKNSKRKHRSRHSLKGEDSNDEKEKSHKQSKKKRLSSNPSHGGEEDVQMSYHKHSRKKRSSEHSCQERDNDEDYGEEKYHKQSGKKHRSHSHRRSKHESSSDTDQRHSHKHMKESHGRSKHGSSSDTDHRDSHKHNKESQRRSKQNSSSDTDDPMDSHKHRKESHRRRRKHESSCDGDDPVYSHKHRKESHRRGKRESSSDIDHGDNHKHRKESHRRSKQKSPADRNSHKHRKESHRRTRHESSSDTEDRDHTRYAEHLEKEDLEEGEITSKVSDHSRASVAGDGSRETSMDISSARPRAVSQPSETAEVSDDLRAKIRAMLMASR